MAIQVSSYKFATANLNMRTGAGTSYSVITVIPNGAKVEVLESANGWDKVVYNGNTGWATECCAVTTAQDVRDGNFKMPKDKPLKKANTTSAYPAATFTTVDDDDSDLPF